MTADTILRRRPFARRAMGLAAGAGVACAAFVLVPSVTVKAATTTSTTTLDVSSTVSSVVAIATTIEDILNTATTVISGGSPATEMSVTTTTTTTTTTAPPAPSTTVPPTTTSTTGPKTIGAGGESGPPISTTTTTAAPPPSIAPVPLPTVPPVEPPMVGIPVPPPMVVVPTPPAAPVNPVPPALAPIAPGVTPRNDGAPVQVARGDSALRAVAVLGARVDEAVDAPGSTVGGAGPASTLRPQVDVVASSSRPDVALVAAVADPNRPTVGDSGSLLIAIDIPGQDRQLGVELRPSRVAAAWLLWLAVTFVIVAFWLPAPLRRLGRPVTGRNQPG